MIDTFTNIGLPEELEATLQNMGYEKPTPIQAEAIPLAMAGKDILGSAQTGTGKTAAFAIPMLAKLIEDPNAKGLILTPTRELAMQVMDIIMQLLGDRSKVKAACLIGGAPMFKQIRQIKRGARVIVGTPGRVIDHLNRGILNLDGTKFLVLDETDRMLDMGFGIQIDEILTHAPRGRQTLLFSATIPKQIARLSDKYLTEPERVSVASVRVPIEKIKVDVKKLKETEKYGTLFDEIKERDGSILVFVNTKRGADQLAFKLKNKGVDAKAIHGDLRQRQRERLVKAFREQQYRIMIATDVMARGLDIPHIEHVINYDLPQCPEDYIHRIGRTARAGADGNALCMISPRDNGKWIAITRMMDPNGGDDYEERRGGSSRGRGRGGGFRGKRSFGGGGGGRGGPRRGGGGGRSGQRAKPGGFRPSAGFRGKRSGPKPAGRHRG